MNTPKEPNIKRVATNNVPILGEDDEKKWQQILTVLRQPYYILVKSSNRPRVFLPTFWKVVSTISVSFAVPNRPAYQ